MATATLLFPWINDYCVNICMIDRQHRQLVDLLNELHQAMAAGKGKQAIGKTLEDLIQYTKAHFATEERLLLATGYPDHASHKAEHDKLAAAVLDFQKKFQDGQAVLTIEIMCFLKDWLTGHIMGCDKKYAPFLKSRGLS